MDFRTSVWNMPLFQYVMYLTIVSILFFGGQMILAGTMKVGELTGFFKLCHADIKCIDDDF